MNTGTNNLIGAALAVLVVMLLLVASRLVRTQATQQEQDAALRPEIDANLALLRAYWLRIRPRESREDEIHSLQKRLYAREFANTPLPPFSLQAYQRQLAARTQSGNGNKAIAVTNFYADLARLQEIQHELQAALAAGQPANAASAEGDPNYGEFLRIAGRAWDDAWHRIERLLAQGNPL